MSWKNKSVILVRVFYGIALSANLDGIVAWYRTFSQGPPKYTSPISRLALRILNKKHMKEYADV